MAKAGSGYLNTFAAVMGTSTQAANTGFAPSQLLTTGSDPNYLGQCRLELGRLEQRRLNSVGWNSVG